MRKQTYIIVLEDQDGRTVDFERWAYKRAQTCIDKIVELYAEWPGLYGKNLERAARVVCYPHARRIQPGRPRLVCIRG